MSGLFGSKAKTPEPPPPPVIQPPAVIPLPDDDAAKAAQRKSIAELLKRKGRASTILTRAGDLGPAPVAQDPLSGT